MRLDWTLFTTKAQAKSLDRTLFTTKGRAKGLDWTLFTTKAQAKGLDWTLFSRTQRNSVQIFGKECFLQSEIQTVFFFF